VNVPSTYRERLGGNPPDQDPAGNLAEF